MSSKVSSSDGNRGGALKALDHPVAHLAQRGRGGAGSEAVELRADGGHHIATRGGVGVAKGCVARFHYTGEALFLELKLVIERGIGVCPRVAADGGDPGGVSVFLEPPGPMTTTPVPRLYDVPDALQRFRGLRRSRRYSTEATVAPLDVGRATQCP